MVVTHKETGNSNTYKDYEQLSFHDGDSFFLRSQNFSSDVTALKESLQKQGVGLSDAPVTVPDASAPQPEARAER